MIGGKAFCQMSSDYIWKMEKFCSTEILLLRLWNEYVKMSLISENKVKQNLTQFSWDFHGSWASPIYFFKVSYTL